MECHLRRPSPEEAIPVLRKWRPGASQSRLAPAELPHVRVSGLAAVIARRARRLTIATTVRPVHTTGSSLADRDSRGIAREKVKSLERWIDDLAALVREANGCDG
jgi:hypothetical protein